MDRVWLKLSALFFGCAAACSSGRPCEVTEAQPSLPTIDCRAEFDLQAARPLDSALPGARTIKTMIDRANGDELHFLDTNTYPLHQSFAEDHLAWPPGMAFTTEYLYPQRRFLLGSVTYYEEPDVFVYELAPYDTATPEMIERSMELIADATYFGDRLLFHPVSDEQEDRVAGLDIPVITTGELFAGISYQPLNLGETIGQVRITTVDGLATDYIGPREIAVLDRVPNDISVVAAVVTEELQTPLSHVNVLSQQRGTPNMALRDAHAAFAPYDGQWVRLRVGAFEWSVEPVTQADADAWWQTHAPDPVSVSEPDYTVMGFPDLDTISVADIPAVGGKAANYGELRKIAGINVRPGFAIPMFYYDQFLAQNGFDTRIAAMLADEQFGSDGNYRRDQLALLRADMMVAPVDTAFLSALEQHISTNFPGTRMRFRSSTNAEDLDGFTGAGLYSSKSGEVGSVEDPVADAVRQVWASLWNFRAYEERDFVSIDHTKVAMAVLVHPAYLGEDANGVAITANIFDPGEGGEDAFYINVQKGEVSVVQPPGSAIVADQLMYYHTYNNQPAVYYAHSSLSPDTPVLSRSELFELGGALETLRAHFAAGIYAPPDGYGKLPMDVEFKLYEGAIWVKQARPYPGRGL